MELPKSPEETGSLFETSNIAVNIENNLMIVVIKPDAFKYRYEIIKKLKDSGLRVVKSVQKRLGDHFVLGEMYKDLPEDIKKETSRHFNEGHSEVILLKGDDNLLQKIGSLTGEKTNPSECSEGSIRKLFGEPFGRETDAGGIYFRNAIHRAKDTKEQKEDLNKFMPLIKEGGKGIKEN